MRCKPGDLAFIVGVDRYQGWLVEVLYRAPIGEFRLPDGQKAWNESAYSWIIKSLGSPFVQPYVEIAGLTKSTPFAAALDSQLRPIRPGNLEDAEQDVCTLEAA